MSDETTTAVAEAPKPAAKPKAKKAAKKVKPSAEFVSLRAGQYRMLKLLAKKARATRAQLVVAATGREDGTLDGSYLGCLDPKQRAITDKKAGKPSLLSRGYVRMVEIPKPDSEAGTMERWYEITAAGRKALTKHDA